MPIWLTALPWRLIGKAVVVALVVATVAWAVRDVRQAYSQRAAYRTENAVLAAKVSAEAQCAEPSLCRQRAAESAAKAAQAVLPYVETWGNALAEARVAQRNAEARRAYEVSELSKRLQEASQRDDSCAAYLRTPIDCDLRGLLDGRSSGEGRATDHSHDALPDSGGSAATESAYRGSIARPADE